MSTPDFGDTVTRVGDYVRYPRRVLLEALRSAFSSEHLFTNSEGHKLINPFLYKQDEKGQTTRDSQLEIADNWTEELDEKDPRPIVLCQRGPLGFHDSSVDSFLGSDPRGLDIKYADFLRMPLTFLCFSMKDLEAEELALAVAFTIRLFRDMVKNNTHIHKVDSPVVGESAVILRGSRSELFSVPVSFSVYLSMVWSLKTTAPKTAKAFAVSSSFRPLRS